MCSGILDEKSGELTHYIRKDSLTKLAKVVDEKSYLKMQEEYIKSSPKEEIGSYKKAILTYEVEKETEDSSVIKVHLQTGRFHQIRAQFSGRGMPLVGDRKYSTLEDNCEIALWSCCLGFYHPTSGEPMRFVLEPPAVYPWTAC